MLRRMALLLTLVLLWGIVPAASAAGEKPGNLDEIISKANQELGLPYFVPRNINGKEIRFETILDGFVLVYGEAYKGSSDSGPQNGQLRYIGQTRNGEDFTNPKFPHDAWAGGTLESRNWVEKPWINTKITDKYNISESYFDGNPKLLSNIQDGLRRYYGDVISGSGSIWNQWHNYVHILQPPTYWTWGMGRMWHRDAAGRIWYISVPLSPSVMIQNPPDLYVKSLDPGTDEIRTGTKYTGTVTFGLKPEYSEPVKGRLTLTHNGYHVYTVSNQVIELRPGEEKSFQFNFTGQNGDSVLEAKIQPVDLNDDANWGNNSITLEIPVIRDVPLGPGTLTFQAVSQDRSTTRPSNTAKWTDWVTATLKPPKPTPPRGTLVWWKVTNAKLTYPKKNPNFTFGTPYGPKGTKTVSMEPDGHVARVEFQEDWAMDGAKIYSMIEKRLMAESPRYYTITASYTVEFKYKYTVRKTDSEGNTYYVPRYGTGSKSGTATGKLLVNGTGVNSRAM